LTAPSVDYPIRSAHRFNYAWPIMYRNRVPASGRFILTLS
jgi:hypothetical protein